MLTKHIAKETYSEGYIDEYIAKNYNVYGSVYGIKTKRTVLAGSVSPGLNAPLVAGVRQFGKLPATLGASNPGLTSLQVRLLYNFGVLL
jgi:hypothetical protein